MPLQIHQLILLIQMVEMLEPEFDLQDCNKVQRKAMVTVMAIEIGK